MYFMYKAFIVPVFTWIVLSVVIAARIWMLQILFAQQLVRSYDMAFWQMQVMKDQRIY